MTAQPDISKRKPLLRPVMTVPQAALYLGVAKNTVYDAVREGLLPHLRFGCKKGTIRIRPEDLEEYVQSCLTIGSPSQRSTAKKVKSGMPYGESEGEAAERQQVSAIKSGLRNG